MQDFTICTCGKSKSIVWPRCEACQKALENVDRIDALQFELATLRAENERYIRERAAMSKALTEMQTAYGALEDENERLRGALEGIANSKDYVPEYDNLLDFDNLDDIFDIGKREGYNEVADVARTALESEGE